MNEKDLKIGTKIIATKMSSGGLTLIGKVLEIVDVKIGYYSVKQINTTNGNTTIYCGYDGRQDDYTIATRKQISEALKEEMETKTDEINKLKEEIDYYDKYNNDEEYLAAKIDQLMNTKGIAAKAEILRELRRSNYL